MTPEIMLGHRVQSLRTRLRMLVIQRWLVIGLAGGLAVGAALAALTQLRWWPDAIDWIGVVLTVGLVIGLVIGLTYRFSSLDTARMADERLGLKDRLSSAFSFSRQASRDELMEAQIADTVGRTKDLRPAQVFPWRLPPEFRWALAAGALVLAIHFLPEMPVFHSKQEIAEQKAMTEAGKKIRKLAKELEKRGLSEKTDAQIAKQIAKNLEKLGRSQELNRISKKQAMLQMNDLMKQLKQLENKMSPDGKGRSLQDVAKRLRQGSRGAGNGKKGGAQANQQQLQQMADALDRKDLDAAAKQLEDLAKKLQSGELSAADAEAAAETLQQMAEAMKGSSLDQVAKDLEQAAKQLQDAAQQAQALQDQLDQTTDPQQRQQLQQQIQQTLQQGAAQAGECCQSAAGT